MHSQLNASTAFSKCQDFFELFLACLRFFVGFPGDALTASRASVLTFAISALLPLVAVAQAASHREGGGDLVRNFQHHIFGHIGVIPFQVDSRHYCPPFQKVVGECGLKWRIGGPRHLGASGHRDQKKQHIKTPAQQDAMRTHDVTLRCSVKK